MIFSPSSNLLCGLITTENLTKKPPQKLHKISPYAQDTLAQPALSKSLLNPDTEGTNPSSLLCSVCTPSSPKVSCLQCSSRCFVCSHSLVPCAATNACPVSHSPKVGSVPGAQPLHKRADGFLLAGISLPSRDIQ